MQLNTTTLEGMEICCINPEEIPIVYNQVQEYFKHGIQLKNGNVVFDVGANIGLFSLWLSQQYQDLTIYAFEPVPRLFEALSQNLQQVNVNRVIALPFGLGSENATVTFNCHRYATVMSTAYPYTQQEKEAFQQAVLSNVPEAKHAELQTKLELMFETEPVPCQLRTANNIIQEMDIQQIDLLKIDVEKAELDVIQGFSPEDWSKVRQVVLEIHNLDNRLEIIQSLLSHVGFRILAVDQEPLFKGSNIYNLYASR